MGGSASKTAEGKTAEEQMNHVGEEVSQAAQDELFTSSTDSAAKWEADKKAPQDVLDKIHGLFQQATAGDASGEPPANEGMKAKFEAWTANKGMYKEDAMAAYTNFINEKKAEYGGA
ncbi:unnamed protein product [Polarella glacialis]|uniref:ACB domain-containing protein n=1 Tax=Polarella glacialis TaxID=89957 RepID=A0A813GU37_POLGL|nr:unnamed protein product [Polarella glacialis]